MRLLNLAAAVLPMCCCSASEDAEVQRNEWRVLAGITPSYEVTERKTPAGGTASTYDWQGSDDTVVTGGIQWVGAFGEPRGRLQPIWGVELRMHGGSSTPESYGVNGASYANTDSEEFSYVGLTPLLIGGFRFAEPTSARLGLIAEVQAGVGGTLLSAEVSNQYGSDRSLGFGADVVGRLLVGLREDGWSGSVILGVRQAWASVDVDFGSYSSELELEAVGAEVMLAVGHTF